MVFFLVIWICNVLFLQGKPGSPGSPGVPGEPVSTDLSSGLTTQIFQTPKTRFYLQVYMCIIFFLRVKEDL